MRELLFPQRTDDVSYVISSPESELIQAVILRAIYDCYPQRPPTNQKQNPSRDSTSLKMARARDAREWLFSDSTQPWSFVWCLEQVVPDSQVKACVQAIRLRIHRLQTEGVPSDIRCHNVFARHF